MVGLSQLYKNKGNQPKTYDWQERIAQNIEVHMGVPNMLIDDRKPINRQSHFGGMFDYGDTEISAKQNAGGYDTYGKFEDDDDDNHSDTDV